jgi:peptidoglycan hydrolase CwlO-like protein
MSKTFEEKVLQKLDALEKGQSALEKGQSALEKGQSALEKGQNSLQKGQASLKQEVARLGVLQEEMKSKIDSLVEIGKAQKELWEKSATKEDIHDIEVANKLQRLVTKDHSVSISDHDRRIKRLEAKTNPT